MLNSGSNPAACQVEPEVSSFLSGHRFNQLVILPTHIDGGAFSILRKQLKRKTDHEVVIAEKQWKITTPEYISYLQVSWTKLTFANQEKPRKMPKSRPTPPTTVTTTS